MTPQQIVALFVRLFSVWLALTGVGTAWGVYSMLRSGDPNGGALLAGVAVLYLVPALLLWIFPMAVAHKLVPRTRYDNLLRVPAHEAAVVACAVLGLWLLVMRVLPQVTTYAAFATYLLHGGGVLAQMGIERHVDLVVALVQLAAAMFLITRADRIVARILDGGEPPQPPDDPGHAEPPFDKPGI